MALFSFSLTVTIIVDLMNINFFRRDDGLDSPNGAITLYSESQVRRFGLL